MIRHSIVPLCLLLVGACGAMREPPPTIREAKPVEAGPACVWLAPGKTQEQSCLESLKFRLFTHVEEERHRLNAEALPLALDPTLSSAAQVHSDDMAMKMSFDVMNPDGNPAVNALLIDPKFQGYVAENAAAQYFTPGTVINPEALAKAFVDIWLNSPSHKSNLTFERFDRTGIGIAVSGNTIYAAELFATDFGLPQP